MPRRTATTIRAFDLWLLPAPTGLLTPAAARRWLVTEYPRLSGLAAMSRYRDVVSRSERIRDEVHVALCGLAGDLDVMVRACTHAITTGRAVAVGQERRPFPPHAGTLRSFRTMRLWATRKPWAWRYKLDGRLEAIERHLAERVKAARSHYRERRLAREAA